MILKYVKYSVYSILAISSFWVQPSFAVLETEGYPSQVLRTSPSTGVSFKPMTKTQSAPTITEGVGETAKAIEKKVFKENLDGSWSLIDKEAFLEATQRFVQQALAFQNSLPSYV